MPQGYLSTKTAKREAIKLFEQKKIKKTWKN